MRTYATAITLNLNRSWWLATIAGYGSFQDDHDPVNGETEDQTTPSKYNRLTSHQTYVAQPVSLSLPPDAPSADKPQAATIIILSDGTDVAAETGIGWLASGKHVAFIGNEGQATLVEWTKSPAYAESFESGGVRVGSPPPDFVVAVGVGQQYISKHGFTWNDTADPDDERYLAALEQVLEEISEI